MPFFPLSPLCGSFPPSRSRGLRKGTCLSIRTAQDFSTRSINRAPENRSGARFLGRGGAALQVVRFAIRQNADSIGVRRRGRNDKDGLHFQRPIRLRGSLFVRRSAQGDMAGERSMRHSPPCHPERGSEATKSKDLKSKCKM